MDYVLLIIALFLVGFLHIVFFSSEKSIFCLRVLEEKYENMIFSFRWFRLLWEPWHCRRPMFAFNAYYATSGQVDCRHKKKGPLEEFNEYYVCSCCGYNTTFYTGD